MLSWASIVYGAALSAVVDGAALTAPAYCPSHRHRPPRGRATGRRPCQAQHRAGGEDSDGQQPTGKAGERFKVVCGCQPPRSFWIPRLNGQ
jgi:hypothetical protein